MIAQAVKLRQEAEEERLRLLAENERLQNALKDRFQPTNIIGNSPAMQSVYDLIARVSVSDATVLLRGESGTGKELVANAIHYNSPRAEMALVKVNCAALPETVVESELFGHEKGAFTGALARREGRFEMADGGTIFLDEVGDFSPAMQVKLLRVLQEREFERVGGNKTIKVDVRVIAASNRDLETLIRSGEFRQDLYYRLNVFPIQLPPLRERRTDIPLLVDHFVERCASKNNKPVRRVSPSALGLLMRHDWLGNVRELENAIERAVLLSSDGVIHAHHLPPTMQTEDSAASEGEGGLQAALDSVEKDMIIDALRTTGGNQAEAARILGISERMMGLRVKKHDIEPRQFRASR
jgi:Nif-specific regulatory protein